MDAVILAGGRGQRVAELAGMYRKPLMEVNGVPLVRRSVILALGAGVAEPIVVVSPENAWDVSEALHNLSATLIIQRKPLGPGDALRVGLQVRSRQLGHYRVMVLLSDNVTTEEDVDLVTRHETAVGVRTLDRAEAGRYTWFDPDRNDWVEKVEIPDGPPVDCWVGPFVGWRDMMETTLAEVCQGAQHAGAEALIGPYLGRMTNRLNTPRVAVTSVDVGTPESYKAVKG